MNVWERIRLALTWRPPAPWNPDDDADVQFLREQKAQAEHLTALLRSLPKQPSRNALANTLGDRYVDA